MPIGDTTPLLRLLERDAHTVSRQVESQPAGLRVQLDYDPLVVLEVGDRAALDDRHTSGYRRIVPAQVRGTGQIVDLALGGNAGAAYVSDRNAREFELVLLLIFTVIKRAVTPGESDANGDRAAAEPHVGRRNGSLRDRGRRVGPRRGRGAQHPNEKKTKNSPHN